LANASLRARFYAAQRRDTDLAPHPTSRLQRGFTLLELLVVMLIIGLLAGYVGPKLFAQIGKSETKVTRVQLDALQKALDPYRIDAGRYPATEQGLSLQGRPFERCAQAQRLEIRHRSQRVA
jgi:prepilin-type N-terminal cleavage/methylation domain-containing protein